MEVNTLRSNLHIFFGRKVKGQTGEDLVEKQNAEQGLMPFMFDEAAVYGYTEEDRHMVRSFIRGEQPRETWEDGLEVVKLMMSCYMSAEQGKTLHYPPPGMENFVPQVAQGTWKPCKS